MTNQQAIFLLQSSGIINIKTAASLLKRADRAQEKARKEAQQENVNGAVAFAVGQLLKDKDAIQHRAVWNLVGREEATREEVLNGLRALRDANALSSFKQSGNNFQVFWTVTPTTEVEV
jgi:hypothetical protein